MSLRLGEVLIQKGLIDEHQLKNALDAQLIYGGHVGTCLVELGFVDVDSLGQVLAEIFSLGNADRDKILCIDSSIVAMLSPALVKKHLVIPFDLKDKVLHVAMVDPGNLLALDELSFATGFRIEAWIAPEILVHRAMEHYYEIPRQLRHITVSGQLAQPARPSPTPEKHPEAKPDPVAAAEPQDSASPPSPAESGPVPEPVPTLPPSAGTNDDAEAPKKQPVADDRFVIETRPRQEEQEPLPGTDGPHPRNGRMAVEWIKFKRGERQRWSDLFSVPLKHEHFDDLAGVYVIWHNGINPVVRVGQGYIRTELRTLRLDPRMISTHAESPLFVTWAVIPREHRDGTERYLADMLSPQFMTDPPQAVPIEVNLPR